MAAEMVTENGAETTTQKVAETAGRKDGSRNCRNSIASDPKSEESHTHRKIGFKFERFKDKNRCQSFQEIPIDEFKTFAEGLEKKFNLPDDVI